MDLNHLHQLLEDQEEKENLSLNSRPPTQESKNLNHNLDQQNSNLRLTHLLQPQELILVKSAKETLFHLNTQAQANKIKAQHQAME